jgi:hypothetical protein
MTDSVDQRLEEGVVSIFLDLHETLWIVERNEENNKEPTIGIEPMTIALQVRCSNL